MPIINRNSLKSEFQRGNQALPEYFEDLIDSTYNRSQDSILMGPNGMTGQFGLLGPTGGTYIGFFISGITAPTGPSSTGTTGMIVFGNTGSTGVQMFIHNGTQWFRFEGSRSF